MTPIYPHLAPEDAEASLGELESSIAEGGPLRTVVEGGLHPRTRYAASGEQVSAGRLRELRADVLNGIDGARSEPRVGDARKLDIALGVALDQWFEREGRAQAARLEIWAYLSLVVLPDVVVERFGPGSDGRLRSERFLPGRRNALYRAYLRAWILGPVLADPSLELYEDELVGVVDRNLSADHRVARVVAEHIARASAADGRRVLVREALKALQFELRVTDLGLLDDYELRVQIGRMFQAASAIKS